MYRNEKPSRLLKLKETPSASRTPPQARWGAYIAPINPIDGGEGLAAPSQQPLPAYALWASLAPSSKIHGSTTVYTITDRPTSN